MLPGRLLDRMLAGDRRATGRVVAIAQVAALVLGLLMLIAQLAGGTVTGTAAVRGSIVAVGLVGWRLAVFGLRRRHPVALVADAVVTVMLLSMTGSPNTAFYLLSLAGVVWAGLLRRPRGAPLYATFVALAYLVLLVPRAYTDHELSQAAANLVSILVVALFAEVLLELDPRSLRISSALAATPRADPQFRRRLAIAVRHEGLPVDAVLAAAEVGLTAPQAELLAHLLLGLSNAEIADALAVSEATVKFRLTALYRSLGVHRRREAVARAHALGLTGLVDPVDRSPARPAASGSVRL